MNGLERGKPTASVFHAPPGSDANPPGICTFVTELAGDDGGFGGGLAVEVEDAGGAGVFVVLEVVVHTPFVHVVVVDVFEVEPSEFFVVLEPVEDEPTEPPPVVLPTDCPMLPPVTLSSVAEPFEVGAEPDGQGTTDQLGPAAGTELDGAGAPLNDAA